MRPLRLAGLAALLAFLQACSHVPSAPPPVSVAEVEAQMPALERTIFELVQAARRKADPNAKTLALDAELAEAARAHSIDMATRHYFAHAGPDGLTAANIIMDRDDKFQGLLGENLAAQHFTVGRNIDVEAFARAFVDIWLASPRHRENLSFAAYDRSGVGAALSGDTIYVTDLFAADLGLRAPAPDVPQARLAISPPAPASPAASAPNP